MCLTAAVFCWLNPRPLHSSDLCTLTPSSDPCAMPAVEREPRQPRAGSHPGRGGRRQAAGGGRF